MASDRGLLLSSVRTINEEHVKESSNKTNLNIGGQMSEQGSDRAGIALAHYLGIAAIVVAIAILVWAASWVKWW